LCFGYLTFLDSLLTCEFESSFWSRYVLRWVGTPHAKRSNPIGMSSVFFFCFVFCLFIGGVDFYSTCLTF
jgi:hypothetical protein